MRMRTIGYALLSSALALAACGGESVDSLGGGSGGTAGTAGSAGTGGTSGSAGSAGMSGGAGMGGSGGSSGVPFDDIRDMIVQLQCDAIMECAGDIMSIYLPGMDCESYFGRAFEDGDWPNMQDAVEDGRVIYHGEKVEACFDAWAALGCDMFTNRAPEICEEALEGTVDEGGDCTLDMECKGPMFCKIEDACPGTCSARQSEGATCESADACENGLTCDDELEQCAVPGKAGDACNGGEPACVLGLYCDQEEDTQPGTCKEISELLVGEEDETCDLSSAWCKPGLSCVVVNWTAAGPEAVCKPTVASGAACYIGLPNQCPPGEYCDADPQSTGSFEGKCVPSPGDGEPCASVATGVRCQPYHVCDANQVCQEMQRLDGDCANDDECHSANCASAKCSPTDPCAQ